MEHHRTRPRHHGQRREAPRPPLPPQAGRRPAAAERRPAPAGSRAAAVAWSGRPSGPRLTGLGGGLFCVTVMFLVGFLDDLLFGASLTVYGVLSLPVCALTALWVRGSDLLTAPVVVPISFAAGLLTVADDGGGGFLGGVVGLVTALSTQAGWLYGGTLVAGVIVIVRRIRLIRRRRRG